MASALEGRTGMAWLVMAAVLATAISLAHSDAGHFFAETPKHLPRIGRRGDLPPLATLLTEDTRSSSSGKLARTMTEALAQLDSDGDGCIGIAELIRIPVVRVAILLQNPELLIPDTTADENDTRETYAIDQRPEPRLLRFLQK